jgi:hypothetical protein
MLHACITKKNNDLEVQTWTNCILSPLSSTSLGLPDAEVESTCSEPVLVGLGGWEGGGAKLVDLS